MGYSEEAKREAEKALEAGHGDIATQKLIEGLPDSDLALDDDDEKAATAKDQSEIVEEIKRQDKDNRGPSSSDADDSPDDVAEADEGDSESEEAESDPDDEGEAPRLDLDDPETAEALVTVKIDGEEQDVSLREAADGYMRQSAFTRKTQEVAEVRKAAESARDEYAAALETFGRAVAEKLPESERQALAQHYETINTEAQESARREWAKTIAAEQAKLADALGWESPDSDDAKAYKRQVREYATEHLGFTDREIDMFGDARTFIAFDKARRFDELQDASKEVRTKSKKRSKTLKPGSRGPKKSSEKRRQQEAKKRFRRTGSMRDGAAVLEALDLVD